MSFLNRETDYIMEFFAEERGAMEQMEGAYEDIYDFDAEYQTDDEAIDYLSQHAAFVARVYFMQPGMSKYSRAVVSDFLNRVRWYEIGQTLYVDFGAGEQWDA